MDLDEFEAQTFLTYLRNTDPALYATTIAFIRNNMPASASGLGVAAPVTVQPQSSVMQNITSGLNTAISALAPLAQSYKDYKTQAANIKAQSAQNAVAIKTANQQQAALDYQNQQKLAFYNNFKTFGIPSLAVLALFIWKRSENKNKSRNKVKRLEA